jgi:hypothetical protein
MIATFLHHKVSLKNIDETCFKLTINARVMLEKKTKEKQKKQNSDGITFPLQYLTSFKEF